VADGFTVEEFRAVDCGTDPSFGHFQALILRVPA